jgi:hypothetical protein
MGSIEDAAFSHQLRTVGPVVAEGVACTWVTFVREEKAKIQ